ncbi:hypothetical protein P4V41_07945 [Fictibacillus nanhaiensis]|uniref:hypothetical protein n=1 Tax=Fictibacillus nanhaiensis TaxID=742169 RepID=UPI002E24DC49|nr:hypothetical protein [Fictibacillus nanhaiensis]
MSEKFDIAFQSLFDNIFDLGMHLQDRNKLTDIERKFLNALDNYVDALDELEQEQK